MVALLGYQSKWYCIPNAIPDCSAIQKYSYSTRAHIRVHWQAHSGNWALAPKKCMHKTLAQQKLLTPSEYRSTGRNGQKTISPPPNWPQQSKFETRRHNHFKCCTTNKLKPLFWNSHAAPKHLLCGSQQSFNKTCSVAIPKIEGENC